MRTYPDAGAFRRFTLSDEEFITGAAGDAAQKIIEQCGPSVPDIS